MRARGILVVALTLAACGADTPPVVTAPIEVSDGGVDAGVAAPDASVEVPATENSEQEDPVYAARAEAESARASALAEKGGFAEAERVLRAVAADGEKAPVQAPTTWLRTGLAWLRWADGDPKGAIADVEQSARDAAAAHYMGNMSVLMEEERQHDIAMMWCEILAAGPVSEKARARQHLKTARSAFSEAAGMIGDGHATAGLAALCAVRSRDRKAAQAAVHLAETSAPPFGNPTRDPDLYAFGLAYDLLGEHAKADEARSKIGGGVVGFALRRRIAEEASKKNAP